MSKLLSEYTAKKLYHHWKQLPLAAYRIGRKNLPEDLEIIKKNFNHSQKFVIKVDQQVKSRMKKNLIKLGATLNEISSWIHTIQPKYKNFIVEPMIDHIEKEIYLLIRNVGLKIEMVIAPDGGINVGSLDNVPKIILDFGSELTEDHLKSVEPDIIPTIKDIYQFYQTYHLTFLEINPLALVDKQCIIVDMLAKYDSSSLYLWDAKARSMVENDYSDDQLTKEERYIYELGQKTGSSLKFTLLNLNSRAWFILFGGGASVTFFDKWMKYTQNREDLRPANYSELSGNPSQNLVYEYTKQIFGLISQSSATNVYLIIGGAIANFTLVDRTFAGIIDAVRDYSQILVEKNVRIYARRGGPNYQIGLQSLQSCCLGYRLKCEVRGPDESMTSILDSIAKIEKLSVNQTVYDIKSFPKLSNAEECQLKSSISLPSDLKDHIYRFHVESQCLIFGNQAGVAQNMLDFDYLTGRKNPSVVGLVDPSRSQIANIQLFWKKQSILVPVYPTIKQAMRYHPVDGLVNFASYRIAYETTKEALLHENIKFVSIVAEGMAENQTKELITLARKLNKTLIGPSTIGAILPGKFRIGNAGGDLENLINNHLYQTGSVGIVTRSGGLLNELCHTASKLNIGVAAAISIGGDRFTGTSFADIIQYYEELPEVRVIIMLGEVGGVQEIAVADLVEQFTKPIIGLCLGSANDFMKNDIQFGHAGADAESKYEVASYKNTYMNQAGIYVPQSWEDIEILLTKFSRLYHLPTCYYDSISAPLSLSEAVQKGVVRKHPNFFSSISDEKNHELTYDKKPVSEFDNLGNVIGHLWFKKELPNYLCKYFEQILIICADHGPCVSGAQNTMITARAGKDLVSSLCSGLLTIGPKFGGAINEAAKQFYEAFRNRKNPQSFVKETKLIMGIGHKHYSIYQPDKRVTLLNEYVEKYFMTTEMTRYAREVEKITTQKRPNLILNVDGFIAVSLIDGFISAKFGYEEVEEIIQNDILNGFFVLARTIGLVGHFIDQKRLKQDLYRADANDVAYL